MASLDRQIELARRHVAEGRRIVTAQRLRIERGEVDGEDAHRLLASFEASLEIFEQDLARLLSQRDGK
jgi:hypothetical protein